jgi:ABC-2 type transport system ATP-binding protein
MSVEVSNLSKQYGSQMAVDHIDFSAKKGEILGFLGPNGAGKSTTMKIITGYVAPTSGEAKVCGISVNEQPLEAAAKVGYLPEHNPLYLDMYVKEYLAFVAGLHKLNNPSDRIQEMITITGLDREQKKKIGQLSKGYRQRVGLAQAMIHDPEVLILDEPTAGLDPNQLVEIRALIKSLGREKTVLFSTHIMQEVQALCDHVVIIDKGKIVANDTIDALEDTISGQIQITVQYAAEIPLSKIQSIPGVSQAKSLGNNRYTLSVKKQMDPRKQLFDLALNHQTFILEMKRSEFSVEQIFQKLTGGSSS